MWSRVRAGPAPEHREADPTIAGGQISKLRSTGFTWSAAIPPGGTRCRGATGGQAVWWGFVKKLQLLEKDNERETKDNENDRAARAESALPNG